MKILLDQNVDHRIKQFLESKDFNVYTTAEEDLSSESDKKIIDQCLKHGFAILTHDDDFLSIKEDMKEHPTIIFLPQRIRFREMKRRLENLQINSPTNQEIFP